MSVAEQPHFPEFERSRETIFPLDSDLIKHRMEVFDASSEDFLDLAIKARGEWGQATSLYATIYGRIDELILAHQHAGEFEPGAELYYKVGLLYGMDIAQQTRLIKLPFAKKLASDNYEAYKSTINYLEQSYFVVGEDTQYDREQYYTGAKILSDTAREQYELFVNKIGPVDAVNDIKALHSGLLDGVIFIAAYDAYTHGRDPMTFDEMSS